MFFWANGLFHAPSLSTHSQSFSFTLSRCSHCQATSPASLLPHPLTQPFFPGTIILQQHSWLPSLFSPSSSCLSFIHPSTKPCSLLWLFPPISPLQRFQSLSPPLFFFSLLSPFVFRGRDCYNSVCAGQAFKTSHRTYNLLDLRQLHLQ